MKTWVDRLVEYAGRRKITNTTTGTSQIVDVERAEGTVSKEGDAFSAANMNALEQRIDAAFTAQDAKVIEDLDDIAAVTQEGYVAGALALKQVNSNLTAGDGTKFRYGVTDDGKPGYIVTDGAGADTVVPFNNGFLPSFVTDVYIFRESNGYAKLNYVLDTHNKNTLNFTQTCEKDSCATAVYGNGSQILDSNHQSQSKTFTIDVSAYDTVTITGVDKNNGKLRLIDISLS